MRPPSMLAPAFKSAAILALFPPGAISLAVDFSVLTMNVAGLPDFLNSNDVPGDKAINAETIGELFARYKYDVINVQEDFNYHAYIYSTDTHEYRTPTSGGVPFGDGLNSLSNFPWTGFARTGWDECSNASGWDCLTPKGFTYMRVLVPSSEPAAGSVAWYIDMYNLHTDAGVEGDDIEARNSNLDQLGEYILKWSNGLPVLVFGDTNSRYTRSGDNIEAFLAKTELSDVWVELIHDGIPPDVESVCGNPAATNECEVVDKVFYRGSALGHLSAIDFNYESAKFLQADGSVLSDHNPIRANFSLGEGSVKMSPILGGPHGEPFSDVDSLTASTTPLVVSKLVFRGGSRLDSVGVVLSGGESLTHGGDGGTEAVLTLGPGEYWTRATLCQGKFSDKTRLFYIEATTSEDRVLEAGSSTSDCASISAPDGWQISGFLGRDGDEIDELSLLFTEI